MDNNVAIKIFQRDNYTCKLCNNKNEESNLVVVNMYGNNYDSFEEYLTTVCKKCYDNNADENFKNHLQEIIFGNTDYFEVFMNSINIINSLLREVSTFDKKNKKTLNRLLYLNVITSMETYLSDAFINTVINNPLLERRLIETSPKFKNENIKLSDVFSWIDNKSSAIVQDYLLNIVYHDIWTVKKMYKDVLDICFPHIEEIRKAIIIRHDIVHRNGKNKKSGSVINISDEEIFNIIDKVKILINYIDTEINKKIVIKNKVDSELIEKQLFHLALSNFEDESEEDFNQYIKFKSYVESVYGTDYLINKHKIDESILEKLIKSKFSEIEGNEFNEFCRKYANIYLPVEKLEVPFYCDVKISDIINLKKLKKLDLEGDKFNNFDEYVKKRENIELIGTLSALEELNLAGNQLENINFISNLRDIKELKLYCNKIKSIEPLSKLKKIVYLSLFKNEITDLKCLKGLEELEKLDLAENQIKDIEPLKKLKKLKKLYLQKNEIEDFTPLFELKELTTLFIRDNKIKDYSVVKKLKDELPNIKYIDVEDDVKKILK